MDFCNFICLCFIAASKNEIFLFTSDVNIGFFTSSKKYLHVIRRRIWSTYYVHMVFYYHTPNFFGTSMSISIIFNFNIITQISIML